VLRRHAAGQSGVRIARELGLTKQCVSAHLRSAGLDPSEDHSARARERWAAFRDVWNASADVGAAAAALG
jgi:hypothetical protein